MPSPTIQLYYIDYMIGHESAYNRYIDEKEEPTLGKCRVAQIKISLK